MITSTGVSLRSLGSVDLFDAAYALMVDRSMYTEEEHDAIEALDGRLTDSGYESDTGLPAITQWMKPANSSVLPPGTMGPDVGGSSG